MTPTRMREISRELWRAAERTHATTVAHGGTANRCTLQPCVTIWPIIIELRRDASKETANGTDK